MCFLKRSWKYFAASFLFHPYTLSSNKKVIVNYHPGPEYPICEAQANDALCCYEGTRPFPLVRWYSNGKLLPNKPSVKKENSVWCTPTIAGNSFLPVNLTCELTSEEFPKYRETCNINNTVLELVSSDNAAVSSRYSQIGPISLVVVQIDSTAELRCTFSVTEVKNKRILVVSFQCYNTSKNASEVLTFANTLNPNTTDSRFKVEQNFTNGTLKSILVIEHTDRTDDSTYQCDIFSFADSADFVDISTLSPSNADFQSLPIRLKVEFHPGPKYPICSTANTTYEMTIAISCCFEWATLL